ncbi:MAG: ABC transporter substrate-binding protein [Acidobacteriota bacterium]|nr:ABC transporter substrate-binding protein [Acidobacteriota bacterium]MDW3228700.1 ABC transporter substrate-binding protein [Acidobacteriota bacterium]
MKTRKLLGQPYLLLWFLLVGLSLVLFLSGCKNQVESLQQLEEKYTIGVVQAYDSPSSDEVVRSMLSKLEEYQEESGQEIEVIVLKAHGQVSALPEMAKSLAEKSRILVPISTAALQAAMIVTDNLPIIFSSVANPYIVRAGKTAVDHSPRVTGVCSTAPIRQVLELILQLKPEVKKIGTIWTPSEINSEYYLELMRESAIDYGLEIVAEPISGAQDIVQAVQSLVGDRVEVLFPVSDNTINTNFELVGRLAQENHLPLFAAFALGAELGACISMGFDFEDIGHKTAELIIRVKNGESPARIPFQYIDRVKFFVNEEAARLQGIDLPESVLKKADKRIETTRQTENFHKQWTRSEE